jgi:6-pyruvoyltetrahydropterin/6-carboxytetrahydropterin synthase
MPYFHIRIAGDDLVFCAGHFLVLEGGLCERLHGHSYRVSADVSGPLNEDRFVVDFLAFHDAMKGILAGLDHRVLLPTRHPALCVTAGEKEVEVMLADRRWVFPADDCLLLPISTTTTELLAQWIGQRLTESLTTLCGVLPGRVRVEVGEGSGFSAVCELP